MLSDGDRLITFDSTHHALRAETLLEAAGVEIMIIPTPREITASCGLAIRYREADAARLKDILRDGGIQVSGRYHVVAPKGDATRRYVQEGQVQ